VNALPQFKDTTESLLSKFARLWSELEGGAFPMELEDADADHAAACFELIGHHRLGTYLLAEDLRCAGATEKRR